MKKVFYLIGILLIIMTVNSCSIDIFGTPDYPIIYVWTVGGETIFNGTPDVGTTVKLAAFGAASNVVTVTDGGAFSLDIDARGLEPVKDDTIRLRMWEDDNVNNEIDSGERTYGLEPAPGDCPVFGKAREGDSGLGISDCQFIWFDENNYFSGWSAGWNVRLDGLFDGYKSVYKANLTGARITNDRSF